MARGSVTNSFTANTQAKASEVNANFTYCTNRIVYCEEVVLGSDTTTACAAAKPTWYDVSGFTVSGTTSLDSTELMLSVSGMSRNGSTNNTIYWCFDVNGTQVGPTEASTFSGWYRADGTKTTYAPSHGTAVYNFATAGAYTVKIQVATSNAGDNIIWLEGSQLLVQEMQPK